MDAITALEKKQASKLADEFRCRGYDVVEDPSADQLPTFLTGYCPDMLLRSEDEDEAIVVVVKSRASLAREPQIPELARLLRAKPGWRLDLVVIGAEEQLESLEGAHPYTVEDISRVITEAEWLLASGHSEAALLRAWSAAEPTVRLLAERDGLTSDWSAPGHLLKEAVVNGVVSRTHYEILLRALRHRNAQAHGFIQPDFEPTLTGKLIDTTKRLFRSAKVEPQGTHGVDP